MNKLFMTMLMLSSAGAMGLRAADADEGGDAKRKLTRTEERVRVALREVLQEEFAKNLALRATGTDDQRTWEFVEVLKCYIDDVVVAELDEVFNVTTTVDYKVGEICSKVLDVDMRLVNEFGLLHGEVNNVQVAVDDLRSTTSNMDCCCDDIQTLIDELMYLQGDVYDVKQTVSCVKDQLFDFDGRAMNEFGMLHGEVGNVQWGVDDLRATMSSMDPCCCDNQTVIDELMYLQGDVYDIKQSVSCVKDQLFDFDGRVMNEFNNVQTAINDMCNSYTGDDLFDQMVMDEFACVKSGIDDMKMTLSVQDDMMSDFDMRVVNHFADVCSKVLDIQTTLDDGTPPLGQASDVSVAPSSLNTVVDIDSAQLSVISWLKTIYRAIQGLA